MIRCFPVLQSPTLAVTAPRAGDMWAPGSTYTIGWNAAGYPGPLKIEFASGSGSFIIADNVQTGPGLGWYHWKVIGLKDDTYQVNISSQTFPSLKASAPPVKVAISALRMSLRICSGIVSW